MSGRVLLVLAGATNRLMSSIPASILSRNTCLAPSADRYAPWWSLSNVSRSTLNSALVSAAAWPGNSS